LYYTLGKNDIVAIIEAPNDEAIASAGKMKKLLKVGPRVLQHDEIHEIF
jgi:uncharacterized protein with GYD domain